MHWRVDIDAQIDILQLLIVEKLLTKAHALVSRVVVVDDCFVLRLVDVDVYVVLEERHAHNIRPNIGSTNRETVGLLDDWLSAEVNILGAELAIAEHIVAEVEHLGEMSQVAEVELDANAMR